MLWLTATVALSLYRVVLQATPRGCWTQEESILLLGSSLPIYSCSLVHPGGKAPYPYLPVPSSTQGEAHPQILVYEVKNENQKVKCLNNICVQMI